MSSKLYRPQDDVEVRSVAFRPARGKSAIVSGPRVIESRGGESVPRDADLQSLLDAARQQGYAAGEAAGIARATDRLMPQIANFGSMAQEVAGLRAKVRQEAERGTVELAIAIARRVLHREIATDPEAILGLVRSAMDRLNARETHRLRVSPGNAAAIAEHRGRLGLPASIEIAADAALGQGSAVFETSRGEVDASITTQLDEIDRGLADVMRRRR